MHEIKHKNTKNTLPSFPTDCSSNFFSLAVSDDMSANKTTQLSVSIKHIKIHE